MNLSVYWMDVRDARAFTYSIKKEIKVAKWGTPKKIFKKKLKQFKKILFYFLNLISKMYFIFTLKKLFAFICIVNNNSAQIMSQI